MRISSDTSAGADNSVFKPKPFNFALTRLGHEVVNDYEDVAPPDVCLSLVAEGALRRHRGDLGLGSLTTEGDEEGGLNSEWSRMKSRWICFQSARE